MQLRFTKMQGLGNDFVMVDAISQKVTITSERARKLADRHFGIGCDQVLVVESPQKPNADFRYRIFNQDGGEVENCGNGARCFALFVRQRGLTNKRIITTETACGNLTLVVNDDNQVTVDMGIPTFEPNNVPFVADARAPHYLLDVKGETVKIAVAALGNPHAVTLVDDVQNCDLERLGPLIEQHTRFPKRVNAGFMQIAAPDTIHLRVYERGVGETLACGTGACAAVVTGIEQGLLDNAVQVNLPGGQLHITWEGKGNPVMMTGPAQSVFKGQMALK